MTTPSPPRHVPRVAQALGGALRGAARRQPGRRGRRRRPRLLGTDLPYLRQVWSDANWKLYEVKNPTQLADPPATVERAGADQLDINVPSGGWVLVRVPWSPWLGVRGGAPGCLTQAGDWTRLFAPVPGRYRLGGSYQLPRGTPC